MLYVVAGLIVCFLVVAAFAVKTLFDGLCILALIAQTYRVETEVRIDLLKQQALNLEASRRFRSEWEMATKRAEAIADELEAEVIRQRGKGAN